MTLYIITEGQTETRFAKNYLADYLTGFSSVTPCTIETSPGHKGGLGSYSKLKRFISNCLKQHQGNDARFTTMIDFFQLPTDFPGREEAEKISDKYQKVKLLEESMKNDIGDWRFVPYIQLHEFEALLYVDLDVLRKQYPEHLDEIGKLQEETKVIEPEMINSNYNTSPGHRITNLIPAHRDNKPVGADLAGQIGIQRLKNACPHFRNWLDCLEKLPSSNQ